MEDSLYKYLKAKNIKDLDLYSKIITLNKGKVVYDTDQPFTDIYEIKSGAIKLGKLSTRGEEYIYDVLKTGDLFGNTAFLPDEFSEFSKAVVPTSLYVYDHDFFRELLVIDPSITEWFITRMVSRWHRIESLFSNVRNLEPRERIIHVYKQLNDKVLTATNRVVLLNKNLTKKDLADLTATTRQLVSNTLQML